MLDLITKTIRTIFSSAGTKKNLQVKSPLLKMIYPVKTLHLLPNRIRFYVPAIKKNPESCDILRDQLIKIRAVNSVNPNVVTGSISICFEEGEIEPEIIFAATIKILGLEEELEKKPDPRFTKEMNFFFRSLNKSIYNQTNGLLDLWNVVVILLSLGAGKQVLSGDVKLPSAFTLFWWAISPSLRNLE